MCGLHADSWEGGAESGQGGLQRRGARQLLSPGHRGGAPRGVPPFWGWGPLKTSSLAPVARPWSTRSAGVDLRHRTDPGRAQLGRSFLPLCWSWRGRPPCVRRPQHGQAQAAPCGLLAHSLLSSSPGLGPRCPPRLPACLCFCHQGLALEGGGSGCPSGSRGQLCQRWGARWLPCGPRVWWASSQASSPLREGCSLQTGLWAKPWLSLAPPVRRSRSTSLSREGSGPRLTGGRGAETSRPPLPASVPRPRLEGEQPWTGRPGPAWRGILGRQVALSGWGPCGKGLGCTAGRGAPSSHCPHSLGRSGAPRV